MEAFTSRKGYSKATVDFICRQYACCSFEKAGRTWRLFGWESILDRATFIENDRKDRRQ